MGTTELVMTDESSIAALALRAFVGGVLVLGAVLLVAHLAQKSTAAHRVLLLVALSTVVFVSSILLAVAWTAQTNSTLAWSAYNVER